jgi:hypothetical protein
MDSIMRKKFPLADIEQNQKFDGALVEQLAKVIEVLPDLEE